jgi:hypothetical protein
VARASVDIRTGMMSNVPRGLSRHQARIKRISKIGSFFVPFFVYMVTWPFGHRPCGNLPFMIGSYLYAFVTGRFSASGKCGNSAAASGARRSRRGLRQGKRTMIKEDKPISRSPAGREAENRSCIDKSCSIFLACQVICCNIYS